MFRGLTNITIDTKGRMAIPSRHREPLQHCCDGQLVVTVDPDHCLLLYPFPDWEEIERKLVRLPSLKPKARSLQRLLLGYATELEIDGHGRILLPQPLRQFAELDRRAVLIGQGNKLELWDEERWNRCSQDWLAAYEAGDADLSAELESLSL
ncbi:MAG TPA: division/cell wall cluster transcriptional repressor MraZ [Gammaproteobacteria bacterium]|nr:division/cell wall cluster transcriptional repressor MraZ [Gammaproteobacteria bacterium]